MPEVKSHDMFRQPPKTGKFNESRRVVLLALWSSHVHPRLAPDNVSALRAQCLRIALYIWEFDVLFLQVVGICDCCGADD